jgi:outer membrane protein assembly factor BamB
VISSPAVADGKVYVGDYNHDVYCLEASSSTLIWQYATNGRVRSSPAVAYGNVYVGSADGNVYAFGSSTSPTPTPTPTATPEQTSSPTPTQEPQQPIPFVTIAGIAITAAVIGAGLGLLIYLMKRNR